MIRLDPLFRRQSERGKRGIATRLRRGLGYRGRLAPKKRGGGPLGGALPSEIEAAPATVGRDGWSVSFSDDVERFDRGSPRQPERPIAGFTPAEVAAWTREVAQEAARQITVSLRSGA